MTTCSTSSTSTPCLVSAAKRTELTPGLSGPVTVIRTFVSAPTACLPFRPGRDPAGVSATRVVVRAAFSLPARLAGELGRCRVPADVRLGAEPLDHVRVVQLERGPLGADPGQLGEVVPRRRAAGGPLERVAVAPRVVHRDDLAVAVALEHVPDERQRRGAEDERADRGDRVQRGETVGGQVVGVPARHALVAEPVLHQERGVEADERGPEVAPCRASRPSSGRSSSGTRSRCRRRWRTRSCRTARSGSAPPRSSCRRRGSPSAGAASRTPVRPPNRNVTRKPSANSIGVSKVIWPATSCRSS